MDPFYNNNKPPPYDECAKLYSILEAALLENPGNLYKLYDSFFPSFGSEPIYALVNFNIHKFNESWPNEYYSSVCWTSSAVLRSVDPSVLASLQLSLLNLLVQTVGASELTTEIVYGERLSLELIVNFTSDRLYFTPVDAVLQDFTLLVGAQFNLYVPTQHFLKVPAT